MFGRHLGWQTKYTFSRLLHLTEFCLVQNSPCVQALRSPISATALHSSSRRQPKFAAWYKEWNYGTLAEGTTYIPHGGHHVGHRPIFLVSSFFLAYSQPSQTECLPYSHTWCGLSANLEYMIEMCYKRLAENTARKISPKIGSLGTIAQLCRTISSQLRHVSTIGKILLNSNISSVCPHI